MFSAHDLDEKEKWIEALESVILRHDKAKQVCSWHYFFQGYLHPCVLYCVFLIYIQKGVEVGSNLFEFEKKLSEADSYLQILIDETKVLFHGDLTKNTTCCTLTCVKYWFIFRRLTRRLMSVMMTSWRTDTWASKARLRFVVHHHSCVHYSVYFA